MIFYYIHADIKTLYMSLLFVYAEVKQIFLTWFDHYSSAHALVDG